MCDHQAGSAWFVGHRWGRRCRDAAQNLLQTSTIDLGGFPLRRICGTERSTTFFFFFNSSVRVVSGWGQSVVRWGRGGGGKKQTQTNKQKPGQRVKTAKQSWQDLFFFVLTTGVNWKTEYGRFSTILRYYKRSERSVRRCATFTTSMRNNQSGHFDRKLRQQTQRKPLSQAVMFNVKRVLPHKATAVSKNLLCSHKLTN